MVLFKSNADNSKVFRYLKEAIKNNNCEFEFIYGSHPKNYPLSRNQFIRILKELKQKYPSSVESNTLDIVEKYIGNIRVTIYGIENIGGYHPAKLNNYNKFINSIYDRGYQLFPKGILQLLLLYQYKLFQ